MLMADMTPSKEPGPLFVGNVAFDNTFDEGASSQPNSAPFFPQHSDTEYLIDPETSVGMLILKPKAPTIIRTNTLAPGTVTGSPKMEYESQQFDISDIRRQVSQPFNQVYAAVPGYSKLESAHRPD